MQLAAGKLDVRVTLQRAGTTTDTWGAEIPTWSDLATVWASQRRASARETLAAAELSASVSDVFEVRQSSVIADLGPKDQLLWEGRIYDIAEVTPIGRYGFRIAPELVRTVLRDDEPDWVNTIFLSTRFEAWRVGGYNEYLYTFFKCLTDERIAYADGWFAEAHDTSASIDLGGYEIQRRCPHLKADLSKFGIVEGNTLTCNLHGWHWNLENGRCLTSRGHELRSSKL